MEVSSILPLVRQFLTAVGAALVTKGYLDVSLVEPIIGLVIAGGSVTWSSYVARQKNKVIQAVAASPVALSALPDKTADKVQKAV